MKYFLLLLLLSTPIFADVEDSYFLYTEVYGPQESLLSPNLEITLLKTESEKYGHGNLRLRGAVRFTGIALFAFYPSYLGGFHYITGFDHKLDLGVNLLYQKLNENYVFNTGTSISFNIGYRHSISESWFVGFALNPTFGKENKPFYPVSLKLGFSL